MRLHITETNAFSDGNFYVQINEVEVLGAFPQPDRANLSWTAIGDNASADTAASFDDRFSTSAINGDPTFQAATPVVGEPTPGPAGSTHSMVVTGLAASTTYYFAVKVIDDAGNVSRLSNTVTFTTSP